MSTTNEDLAAAFAGESQANRKYLFFAERADQEGNKRIARLFRATAEAETVHARNHLRVMNRIGTSKENLAAAISGEKYEFTEMYPGFMEQAEKEGKSEAKNSFDLANRVEQIHHGLFQSAIDELERGQTTEPQPFYVCQYCGNTVEGEAPKNCPVCGAAKSNFEKIE